MKMKEYVDLIREIKTKHGMEWDSTTATLAIYKFIQSPAVSQYYSKLELRRDDNGSPIICEVDKLSKANAQSVGRFMYEGSEIASETDDVSYAMNPRGTKPRENVKFLTNSLKEQFIKLREKFINSNSFAEFCDGFDLNDTEQYNKEDILDSNKLDFKIKKLLRTATFCERVKDDKEYDDDRVALEMVLSLVDDTYKFANHRHQTIVRPILNIMEGKKNLSEHVLFDGLYILANYDNISTESYYFDNRPTEEKIVHYQKLAQMPEIKDNTIFGVVMNNPNDIINKIADKFMFEDLKALALMQTRLAIKSPTLEEMLASRPILDEIYQEAVKRYPLLESEMDDRFQHIKIKDSEFDVGDSGKVSFSTLMDGLELYGEHDKHYYLTLQPNIIAYPRGTNYIMNDQPYERHYGHDGVGPYYVAFARESNFTTDVRALTVEKIFISPNLDDKHIKQMFENLFEDCMVRKLALVMEDPNFHNVIGTKNMQIYNEVKDKYTGIVPHLTCNTDLSQYKAFLSSDLKYNEVLAVQSQFKALAENNVGKKMMISDYYDHIETFQKGQTTEKKNVLKP